MPAKQRCPVPGCPKPGPYKRLNSHLNRAHHDLVPTSTPTTTSARRSLTRNERVAIAVAALYPKGIVTSDFERLCEDLALVRAMEEVVSREQLRAGTTRPA